MTPLIETVYVRAVWHLRLRWWLAARFWCWCAGFAALDITAVEQANPYWHR